MSYARVQPIHYPQEILVVVDYSHCFGRVLKCLSTSKIVQVTSIKLRVHPRCFVGSKFIVIIFVEIQWSFDIAPSKFLT